LQWSAEEQAKRKYWSDLQLAAIKLRFEDWQRRREANDQAWKTFQADGENFNRNVKQFEKDHGEGSAARTQKREKLERDRNSLVGLQQGLTEERARLETEQNQLTNEIPPLPPANRKLLYDHLLAAGTLEFAQRAVKQLTESGRFPSMTYAALVSEAKILQSLARYCDGPDQVHDYRQKAIDAVRSAIETIGGLPADTFADDWRQAQLFVQYREATNLLVDLCVESEDWIGAIAGAELGRSRMLLDRIRHHGQRPDSPRTLDHDRARQVVEQQIQLSNPTLYYYIGDANSYLFVLGHRKTPQCKARPPA
jgi:hypothetical protein